MNSSFIKNDDLLVIDLFNTLIRNTERLHPYLNLYKHIIIKNPNFKLNSKEFFNFSMKNKMSIINILNYFQLSYDINYLNTFYEEINIELDSIIFNKDLIDSLNSLNNKKVVLSNLSIEYSEPIYNLINILDIDKFVFSFNVGLLKPSQEIFSYTSSLFNKSNNQCIMIGDNLNLDIKPSLKAGYKKSILIQPWWN